MSNLELIYQRFKEVGGSVSIDSRAVKSSDMFFAIKGDNFDGNAYAVKAFESGASWAVVSDSEVAKLDSRMILVDDTLATLQSLARLHRRELGITIVALSGTNGKTTTKELLRVALEQKFERVACTKGNLNNHLGVPLTLLSITSKDDIAVVEMGANHKGEIKELCAIAEPNVGLLTNVGMAHLEGFGSFDGVRKTKGELYDWLSGDSQRVAIYNNDDEVLSGMIQERGNALRSVGYRGADGIGRELRLFGRYNQYNAAAALAVALYFGVDPKRVVEALASYRSTNNRSEVVESTPRGNSLVVDCYNANPSSMRAAVEEFISSKGDNSKVMILGEMRELGEYSRQEHAKLVELATDGVCSDSMRLYFVGSEFQGIVPVKTLYSSAKELREELEREPIKNSKILIKGSRGNALESILDLL